MKLDQIDKSKVPNDEMQDGGLSIEDSSSIRSKVLQFTFTKIIFFPLSSVMFIRLSFLSITGVKNSNRTSLMLAEPCSLSCTSLLPAELAHCRDWLHFSYASWELSYVYFASCLLDFLFVALEWEIRTSNVDVDYTSFMPDELWSRWHYVY